MARYTEADFDHVVPFSVDGIPAILGVTFTDYRAGDMSFTLMDRKGYAAPWLVRKMGQNATALFEAAAQSYFTREALARAEP
jgi:hypothetical protein